MTPQPPKSVEEMAKEAMAKMWTMVDHIDAEPGFYDKASAIILQALHAARQPLEETLKWYADYGNYQLCYSPKAQIIICPIEQDRGEKARSAINHATEGGKCE